MSWNEVKDRIEINTTSNQLFYNTLKSAYEKSPTLKSWIDDYVSDGWIEKGHKITIDEKDPDHVGPNANAGQGSVHIPLDWFKEGDKGLGYFDVNGNFVKHTLDDILIHELTHAIKGTKDNWKETPNYDGDNVALANNVYRELNIPEERSYIGQAYADGVDFIFGKSYTKGIHIDTAIVGGLNRYGVAMPQDTTDRGVSNDLIFGTNDQDVLIGGKGQDFIYARGANDRLTGDIVNWDSSKLAGLTLTDDGVRDHLYGGDGYDIYGVAGGAPAEGSGPMKHLFDRAIVHQDDGTETMMTFMNWDSVYNADAIHDQDGIGEVWSNYTRRVEQNLHDANQPFSYFDWVIGAGTTVFTNGVETEEGYKSFGKTQEGFKVYLSRQTIEGSDTSRHFTAIAITEADGTTDVVIADGSYDPVVSFVIEDYHKGDFGVFFA